MKLSNLGKGLKVAVVDGPYMPGALSELEPEIPFKLYQDREQLLDTLRRVRKNLIERVRPDHPVMLMITNAIVQAESGWEPED